MKKPIRNDRDPARQRILVIVILLLHLAFFTFSLFGALLMTGYALEREDSLGVPATPYLALGLTAIVAFILFILTLVYFIKSDRKHLTFASIAGIGGYLVNLGIAMIFELESSSFSSQLMIFFLFVVPMIAVILYRVTE